MSKATVLDQVVGWLHNDGANARRDDFWARARDAISGDVYGVDSSLPGWEDAHCLAHESLWFYACLAAGHVYMRDDAGAQAALAAYREEVGRVGTSPHLRGTNGVMTRPYGA